MDDEREVSNTPERRNTDIVERSKMIFLQEIMRQAAEEAGGYDLHEEFAKTKRNRTLLVPGIVLALVAVFAVGMYFTTSEIQSRTEDVQVTISDVQDVDLMEVLNTAQRLENQIASVQDRIGSLETERDDAIAEVQSRLDRDIRLIQEETGFTDAEQAARIEDVRAEAQQEIAAIRSDYEGRIAAAEEELADLQERLDQYDARRLEQAKEQQEVLDNQARLHELEMQELRQEYEERIANLRSDYEEQIAELEAFQRDFEERIRARHAEEIEELILTYNPELGSEPISELLAQSVDEELLDTEGIASFDSLLEREGVASAEDYTELSQQAAAFQQIIDRLQEIPFENSVPAALEQLEYRNRRIISEYERMWQELAQTVEARDEIIAARNQTIGDLESRVNRFLYAIESLTTENRENGYVLDPRNPDSVAVYVDRIREVQEGTTGLVFRRDDELIARIRFEEAGERTATARVVRLADGKELRPFDKVLIEVQYSRSTNRGKV